MVIGKFEIVDEHPGALPGASKLIVKLMFSRQGVLLKGEVAGGLTVSEIVNIIGTAIENRMTAAQLANAGWNSPNANSCTNSLPDNHGYIRRT